MYHLIIEYYNIGVKQIKAKITSEKSPQYRIIVVWAYQYILFTIGKNWFI